VCNPRLKNGDANPFCVYACTVGEIRGDQLAAIDERRIVIPNMDGWQDFEVLSVRVGVRCVLRVNHLLM
jgi:hypothetical protein